MTSEEQEIIQNALSRLFNQVAVLTDKVAALQKQMSADRQLAGLRSLVLTLNQNKKKRRNKL